MATYFTRGDCMRPSPLLGSAELTEDSSALFSDTILLVDDDDVVRTVLEVGLRVIGLHVYAVGGGEEAIRVFAHHQDQIALVLLDVCMPGLDGPQTLLALRRIKPTLRACFITGHPGNYTLEELRQLQVERIFPKPLPLLELATSLRDLLAEPSVQTPGTS